MDHRLRNKTAIVGVGESDIGKVPNMTGLGLNAQAAKRALDDAGLKVSDIDGLLTAYSFTEPYFLGYRLAAGFDVFNKYSDQTRYSRYVTDVVGGQLRLGLPITEEFGITLRYSLYNTELKVPNTLKRPYNDCSIPIPGARTSRVTAPTGAPSACPTFAI